MLSGLIIDPYQKQNATLKNAIDLVSFYMYQSKAFKTAISLKDVWDFHIKKLE